MKDDQRAKKTDVEERIAEVVACFIPKRPDCLHGVESPLPQEIAQRVLDNAKFVTKNKLRDEVLVILADYHDHAWVEGKLKTERTRLACADLIMKCLAKEST